MKVSIEVFVGVIILTISSLLLTCYITASLNTRNAQNFHSSVIAEVEASDYSQAVIDSFLGDDGLAVTNGYVKDDGSCGLSITSIDVDSDTKSDMAKVVLEYDYTIPLLNLFLEHEIVGYAR